MNKEEISKELSTKIKDAMEQHRYSQSALSNELNVTQQSLSLYISGKVIPNGAVLYIMCKLLGIRVLEIGKLYAELHRIKLNDSKRGV